MTRPNLRMFSISRTQIVYFNDHAILSVLRKHFTVILPSLSYSHLKNIQLQDLNVLRSFLITHSLCLPFFTETKNLSIVTLAHMKSMR
jgi:hypothetical protein